jgi:hypothetical protein
MQWGRSSYEGGFPVLLIDSVSLWTILFYLHYFVLFCTNQMECMLWPKVFSLHSCIYSFPVTSVGTGSKRTDKVQVGHTDASRYGPQMLARLLIRVCQ